MAGGNGVLEPGRGVEPSSILERQELQAEIIIADKDSAIAICTAWGDSTTWPIYSDGSRDAGHVGTGVAWKTGEREWKKKKKVYLGTNKEVIDAELYGILEAVKVARKKSRRQTFRRATVFVDAQSTLHRIKNNVPGPG
jgi:hypothetical protein